MLEAFLQFFKRIQKYFLESAHFLTSLVALINLIEYLAIFGVMLVGRLDCKFTHLNKIEYLLILKK